VNRRHVIVGSGMLGSGVDKALLSKAEFAHVVHGYRLRSHGLSQCDLRAHLNGRPRQGSYPITLWLTGGLVGGAHDNARRGHEYLLDNLGLFCSVYREFVEYASPGDQFVMFGSTCQYPVMREGQSECCVGELINGVSPRWLHKSNRGYAAAKNAALQAMIECSEYMMDRGAAQYFFLPTNLYGTDDSGLRPGNAAQAHVIPALIHRFSAEPGGTFKLTGAPEYTRDFCHVNAAASVAVAYAAENRVTLNGVHVENLPATETDVRLGDLADALLERCNPTGKIEWDDAAIQSSVVRKPARVTAEMTSLLGRLGYSSRKSTPADFGWLDPLVAQYRSVNP